MAGVDKTVDADGPIAAIHTLSDKRLVIKNVTGTAQENLANTLVTLLNGKKQSENKYLVQINGNGEGLKKSEPDKYQKLNQVIARIKSLDSDAIAEDLKKSFNRDELKEYLDSGFIPFKTNYGVMELDLSAGRVEFEGTSMGGDSELYYKIREVLGLLREYVGV